MRKLPLLHILTENGNNLMTVDHELKAARVARSEAYLS
jgi:hypothetical protein